MSICHGLPRNADLKEKKDKVGVLKDGRRNTAEKQRLRSMHRGVEDLVLGRVSRAEFGDDPPGAGDEDAVGDG